jgi:Iron-containing redox enzyme
MNMTTAATTTTNETSQLMATDQSRHELIRDLRQLKEDCGTLSREQVLVILGQWFHPLHYFPTFLSRLISVAPQTEMQTFISRILWQELGEGDPQLAHEKIYISTILDGGFDKQQVAGAAPLDATAKLVEGYKTASMDYLSGLGFLYGTEVVDLPMVSTIGDLMRRCTEKKDLPWVNIHVTQEPHHVESSEETLKGSLTTTDREQVAENAAEMWRLWINFFRSVRQAILQ